ncbi:MAG TPA: DUF2179 domain-containing protein [Bacteroidales bacterium]|nr:DUF2179 domain-containing protein [Bacteroidales bacterium]
METLNFFGIEEHIFMWIVLPIMIFLSRIIDQTFGTLRLIFVSKGLKYLAPIVGFFESTIWLIAVSQIIKNLDNAVCFIAYGLGFATGNYVGMWLEEKISIGTILVRIIPKYDTTVLINKLKASNFGFTLVNATGSTGDVKIIFSIIKRKDASQLINLINEYNPNSFYTIEEVKTVNEGVFRSSSKKSFFKFALGLKKYK